MFFRTKKKIVNQRITIYWTWKVKQLTYTEQLIYECATYLQDNTFNSFISEIYKNIIGQDNLELLLAGIYNYIVGVAREGKPSKICRGIKDKHM